MRDKIDGITQKVKKVIAFGIEKALPFWIPIILITCIIIMCILGSRYSAVDLFEKNIQNNLLKVFDSNKMGMLSTISVVLIGMYVTVMSVFGTSDSRATSEMQQANLTAPFIRYASIGLLSSFTHFILTIFYTNNLVYIYIVIFIWMLGNALRFAVIVLQMYKHNIDNVEIVKSEEYHQRKELMKLLIVLNNSFNQSSATEDNYFEDIKRKNEEKKQQGT